jgi:hypothetical protein
MSEAAALDRSARLFEPGGPLSAAAVAELRDDPRLPQAIRTLTSGILALYRGNRFLNTLINDRGRMIIGYLALYLHEGAAPDGRGSGFGIGQLKALCAAAGIASPGRTGAMVAMMRMGATSHPRSRLTIAGGISSSQPKNCARRTAIAGGSWPRRCGS